MRRILEIMRNRKLMLVGLVLVVGVVGGYLYLNKKPNVGPKVNIREEVSSIIPRAKIQISEVEMTDFKSYKEPINENGDHFVVNDINYQIVYFPDGDYFNISILGSPFETWREAAEVKLLRKLDIEGEEACKLNVVVTTPLFANAEQAGNQYPLSFSEE